MPRLSLFTPLGLLRLTSAPSDARRIYDSKVASLGGDGLNFSLTEGTYVDARLFAESMMRALARAKLRRAGDQDKPTRVYEGLPDREEEYGLVPATSDSVTTRRGALAAAMLLPGGAGLVNTLNVLHSLLGASFLALRVTTNDERALWPPILGAQPMNLQLPTQRRALIRFRDSISAGLGSPQFVTFDPIEPVPTGLFVGDKVVIDPENPGRAEVVTILFVGPVDDYSPIMLMRATFNNGHEAGVTGVSSSFPLWTSNQQEALVVVTEEAAVDAESRRKLNLVMQRLARGVGTWAIVAGVPVGGSMAQTGPFLLGSSPLNATPFTTLTVNIS